MSRKEVELARGAWDRMAPDGARGEVPEDAYPVFDPGVTYVEDPSWPGSGSFRGWDSIRARFREYLDIFGPVTGALQETLDAGDRVVLIFRASGQSAGGGVPFEQEWAYVWRFRDGRVVEWRAYVDKDEALAAAGLRD
ncbi:MAG: nuclear transport factor 2 family protein [Thermoleophilaceae bacterium]